MASSSPARFQALEGRQDPRSSGCRHWEGLSQTDPKDRDVLGQGQDAKWRKDSPRVECFEYIRRPDQTGYHALSSRSVLAGTSCTQYFAGKCVDTQATAVGFVTNDLHRRNPLTM